MHYYEDGNVRMSTNKKLELSSGAGGNADGIMKAIGQAENKFQEDLNRAFVNLAEGSFKSLRRQLPVTRQKVDWDKVGQYRVCLACQVCVSLLTNCSADWSGRGRCTEMRESLRRLYDAVHKKAGGRLGSIPSSLHTALRDKHRHEEVVTRYRPKTTGLNRSNLLDISIHELLCPFMERVLRRVT